MAEYKQLLDGAHFFKADLHIHSYGGSYDVDDEQMYPQNIVDVAITKQLSVISITDHNEITNAKVAIDYAQDKSILVIPGVELSTIQGHLLVYFDTFVHLRSFYERLTISEDKRTCQTGIVECLNLAKELNGLGILAHIDIDAGFEKTIGSFNLQMEEIFKNECLYGIEISSKSASKWYTDEDSSREATSRNHLLQIRCQAINNDTFDYFPKLMSSDAHTIDRLGKNADNEFKLTKIKMDNLSFDSFRIALLSGGSRIRIESELPDIVPRFESMTIDGGLLDKQNIKFSRNLTCIIGGRGTGKSTMLESLKVCSGYNSEASVVDSEVWPSVITMTYVDEEGKTHTFRREKNSETMNTSDPEGIYNAPIECYGQGETAKAIEQCGKNPSYLIRFLNDFVDLQALEYEDKCLRESLHSNRSELTQLRLEIKQKPDIIKIKNNIAAQLYQMKKDNVKELVAYHLELSREREIRNNVVKELNELVNKYKDILSDNSVFENFKSLVTTEIKIGSEHIKNIQAIVEQFSQIVSSKRDELSMELKNKIEELNPILADWRSKELEIQQNIDAKRKELEQRGIPFDIGKINKIIADDILYAKMLKEIENKEKQMGVKLAERKSLVEKRADLSSHRYQSHERFAMTVNQNLKNNVDDLYINLKYDEAKYSPSYRQFICRISQWRNNDKIDAIVNAKTPLELALLVRRGDFSFMDKLKDSNGINIFSADDKDIFWAKCNEDFNYEDLESELFDDLPRIRVTKKIIDGTGKTSYITKTMSQLSMGQQQSIILAILLQSNSKKPLLIDQPEDNLDSEFIYKSIVKNLRRIKEHRQVIIVTHNANIAVLGDAELIIPLKSTSSRTSIMNSGSIDNPQTKALCCEILEGGERAFKKRKQIYNI